MNRNELKIIIILRKPTRLKLKCTFSDVINYNLCTENDNRIGFVFIIILAIITFYETSYLSEYHSDLHSLRL